ncbi:hypothetical protein [Chromohalobacter japonicus]|uniref:hypothetical protein n=1 Tax=Chromohalobacter japonicus TaxID=223900 RepID=UPI000A556689|nr:hypothetical protein [Chromohalobacter japonicus]
MLSEGDRVWVNIPKTGYVGVVTGEHCRADEYRFANEGDRTLPEIISQDEDLARELYPHLFQTLVDEEEAEYLVPVRWLHAVARNEAFSEVGLFGNQNTVCKPTAAKWQRTADRLGKVWPVTRG